MASASSAPTVDPEIEQILVASAKAKSRAKARPRSLDKTRMMKADPRDPRVQKEQWPCFGAHVPAPAQSNAHGQWIHCCHCDLRLLYIPRKGSPSTTTAVVNANMVAKMLRDLQPLLGQVKPTAKICHHMMNKITAETVLQKSIQDILEANPYGTTTAPPTATHHGMNLENDEELVKAYEEAARAQPSGCPHSEPPCLSTWERS